MCNGERETVEKTLLPRPRRFQAIKGGCPIGAAMPSEIRVVDPRIERAVSRWRAELLSRSKRAGLLRIEVDPDVTPHAQGYRLSVENDGISLVGASPPGCFYGLQTLKQLAQLNGGMLPGCVIHDWPDFDTRGLLHDVTRGKVPTLDTVKLLADRLAGLKINQLQLYIEHAFVFSFDADICDADNGLTPDEVRDLDVYCRERFIDVIPALATFGHMGRILSMPQYRHLAEIEATKRWEDMAWPQRARGFTLDCTNPQSHLLVKNMWGDVLDAFSSSVVNICGDEPWDLGEGKNRQRFSAGGKADAYVEHIRRTHDICTARGRRVQLWDDIIRNYPQHISRLPRDITVLHWGYDDDADHDDTHVFPDSGFDTFVCPGTSGWKRILNAVDLAERNITCLTRVGRECGATGLLNTDWGDHGHFNSLAGSWHAIALGAALGWRADHPTGTTFDHAFSRSILGTDDLRGAELLRQATKIANRVETWRLMWMPLSEVVDEGLLPGTDDLAHALNAAQDLKRWCDSVNDSWTGDRRDLAELRAASWFVELFVRKMNLAIPTKNGSSGPMPTPASRTAWADEIEQASVAFADCWRARNKSSGLRDIQRAIKVLSSEERP